MNRHVPPGASKGAASARSFAKGATARAVIRGAAGSRTPSIRSDGSERGRRSLGFLPQEGGLAFIGLDEIERHVGGDRQDQAGKSAAGTEVDCPFWPRRHERDQFSEFGEVPRPKETLRPFVRRD